MKKLFLLSLLGLGCTALANASTLPSPGDMPQAVYVQYNGTPPSFVDSYTGKQLVFSKLNDGQYAAYKLARYLDSGLSIASITYDCAAGASIGNMGCDMLVTSTAYANDNIPLINLGFSINKENLFRSGDFIQYFPTAGQPVKIDRTVYTSNN